MQCHQPLGIKHSSSWPVIDYWFLGSTKKSVPKIIISHVRVMFFKHNKLVCNIRPMMTYTALAWAFILYETSSVGLVQLLKFFLCLLTWLVIIWRTAEMIQCSNSSLQSALRTQMKTSQVCGRENFTNWSAP